MPTPLRPAWASVRSERTVDADAHGGTVGLFIVRTRWTPRVKPVAAGWTRWQETAQNSPSTRPQIPAKPLSPLTDSNRRPLPYHGRLEPQRVFTRRNEQARNPCIPRGLECTCVTPADGPQRTWWTRHGPGEAHRGLTSSAARRTKWNPGKSLRLGIAFDPPDVRNHRPRLSPPAVDRRARPARRRKRSQMLVAASKRGPTAPFRSGDDDRWPRGHRSRNSDSAASPDFYSDNRHRTLSSLTTLCARSRRRSDFIWSSGVRA